MWLSHEPKRQRTDHAVLQCRDQQAGTHYINRSVTLPWHSDNFNEDWKRRCSVWPTGVIWLRARDMSKLLERRNINVRTQLNWTTNNNNNRIRVFGASLAPTGSSWWDAAVRRRMRWRWGAQLDFVVVGYSAGWGGGEEVAGIDSVERDPHGLAWQRMEMCAMLPSEDCRSQDCTGCRPSTSALCPTPDVYATQITINTNNNNNNTTNNNNYTKNNNTNNQHL